MVISDADVRKAVNVLHEEFFENEIKQIHIFICGVGNVGSKLVQQIYHQNRYLNENQLTNLRISGMANSKKMIFEDKGIAQENYQKLLQNGEDSTPQKFAEEILKRAVGGSRKRP